MSLTHRTRRLGVQWGTGSSEGGISSLAFVTAMADVFFRYEAPEIFFHDPLPAAIIFEPSHCQTKACRIGVDLMNKQTLGRTRPITETDSISHRVACSIKVTKFFEHYFSVVSSYPSSVTLGRGNLEGPNSVSQTAGLSAHQHERTRGLESLQPE